MNPATRENNAKLEEIVESAAVAEKLNRKQPPRVAIESVEPQIDGGRFPAKRIIGDQVVVTADLFADGHDALASVVRYRHVEETDWNEVAMQELVNDAWRASFPVTKLGYYEFTVHGWI